MNSYILLGVTVCVSFAAVIDVFTQKIPNWLTLPSMAVGLCLNCWFFGSTGLFSSAQGLLVGFGLLFLVYRLGGMGGGDVKLLAAVGAFVGPRMVFYSFIWMALVGGVLAILLIAYKKAFGQTLQNLKVLLMGWLLQTHSGDANLTIKNQALLKLPYGVAIALGTILAVFLRQIPRFGF